MRAALFRSGCYTAVNSAVLHVLSTDTHTRCLREWESILGTFMCTVYALRSDIMFCSKAVFAQILWNIFVSFF